MPDPTSTPPITHSTRYAQELDIVDHIVRVLESSLAGREKPRLVNRLPIDECHLGVLVPWRDPDEADATDKDEIDDAPAEAAPAPPKVAKASAKATPAGTPAPTEDVEATSVAPERRDDQDQPKRPPSSLGCELLLESVDGEVEIEVEASFSVYTSHLPTWQEQLGSQGGADDVPEEEAEAASEESKAEGDTSPPAKNAQGSMSLAEVMQRNEVRVPPLTFKFTAGKLDEATDGGTVQATMEAVIKTALEVMPTPDAGGSITKGGEKIDRSVLQSKETFDKWVKQYGAGKKPRKSERGLQASLTLRAEPQADGKLRISIYLSNDTFKASTRTEDNVNILADVKVKGHVNKGEIRPIEMLPIAKDYQYDRRVWGVGHNTSVVIEQESQTFRTEALSRYEQPRLTTKDHLPADFDKLADDPTSVLEVIHEAMQDEVVRWKADVLDANSEGLSAQELVACREDWEKFSEEIDRFASGIAALHAVPKLEEAFRGMNRVMGRIAKKKNFKSWRLFQLAFIVTQLPALALREKVNEGEWPASTKHHWEGDEDIADVLWFPTGGGKTEAYLGLICCAMLFDRLREKNLGVTAWLRFPLRMLSVQQLQRAMQLIYESQAELDAMLPPDKSPPRDPLRLGYFVGRTTSPNQLGSFFFDKHKTKEDCEKYKFVTDCPSCSGKRTVDVIPDPKADTLLHTCRSCGYVLPIVITDSEIYRTLPAFLIGTIDKMATMGMQEKFGMLWAGPNWRCPTHGYGIGEYCIFGCDLTDRDIKKLPVINAKDPAPTLHLQDELHLLQEELGAFAGHYETLIRFCEKAAGGAKAKIIAATATVEGFEHQTRHLYGVKSARRFPGRGFKKNESFYARLEPDHEHPDQPKVARVFVAFRPSGTSIEATSRCTRIINSEIRRLYEDEHHALASLPQTHNDKELKNLLFYYSMSLTYVSSLQGGTRIKDLLSLASKEIMNDVRELGVKYISGRSTTSDIADVIDQVEKPKDWKNTEHIDALVATNVISHGVDLERCNLMVMERFPGETAEYIQASSRSGRKKVGLVVVVLPGHNLRAASIYNRFKEYHANLDRMVSPVPVNRFAKYALQRTMPGTISGLLFGISNPTRRTIKHKQLPDALKRLEESKDKIDGLLRGAQSLGEGTYESDLESEQEARLKELYAETYAWLNSKKAAGGKLTDAMRPKPMTSLRDVERGVPFMPAEPDFFLLDWFKKASE